MISPFYKFTAQPACFNIQETKKLRLLLYTRDEVYPRFHSFLRIQLYYPYPSLSTRNVCNPGSGYDTFHLFHRTDSRTHFTKAVIQNCFQPVTVSLFRHIASATLSVQSLSHIEYILCDIILFVNQFPANLRFKKIRLRLDPEFSFLNLHETFDDCKSKSRSFGIS